MSEAKRDESDLERVVIPITKLSKSTTYWWTCTRCNYSNDHWFMGEPPKLINCQACELEHRIV